jgi:hypothetical protein
MKRRMEREAAAAAKAGTAQHSAAAPAAAPVAAAASSASDPNGKCLIRIRRLDGGQVTEEFLNGDSLKTVYATSPFLHYIFVTLGQVRQDCSQEPLPAGNVRNCDADAASRVQSARDGGGVADSGGPGAARRGCVRGGDAQAGNWSAVHGLLEACREGGFVAGGGEQQGVCDCIRMLHIGSKVCVTASAWFTSHVSNKAKHGLAMCVM